MKIVNVSVLMHERRWSNPFLGPSGTMPLGVLSIETDDGLTGNAFLSGPSADSVGQIVKLVKPMLLNRDPLDIGAIWLQLWRANRIVLPMTMGAVDIALWDIAGKAAGLPVHSLLGSCKQTVPVYFSSYMHAEAHEYAEEAEHWKQQGWRGYKLHPPTQRRRFGETIPTDADVVACQAVRNLVGMDMTLMLDSAWEYSYAEALKVGRAIEALDYHWYEDPLAADDLYGYTRLKSKLDIPIVATEATAGGLYALPYWITERATDALRGDVAIKGGITGMMKIAHLAEAFQLPFEVHDAYNAFNNVATLHVIMASATAEWYEVLPFNQANEVGLDQFWYGVLDPPTIDATGMAHVPEEPGVGIEIDWDLIHSGQVTVLT